MLMRKTKESGPAEGKQSASLRAHLENTEKQMNRLGVWPEKLLLDEAVKDELNCDLNGTNKNPGRQDILDGSQ